VDEIVAWQKREGGMSYLAYINLLEYSYGGSKDLNPSLPLFLLNETWVMDGCRVNILQIHWAYSKGRHMDTATIHPE